MNLEPKYQVVAILFGFFGLVVPFIVRIAAGIVKAEEVTAWRCFKAALSGCVALGAGVKVGLEFQSQVAAIVAMGLAWAALIQVQLKTSIPQALGIWLMTHGCVFLIGFTLNHLLDLHSLLIQLFQRHSP